MIIFGEKLSDIIDHVNELKIFDYLFITGNRTLMVFMLPVFFCCEFTPPDPADPASFF